MCSAVVFNPNMLTLHILDLKHQISSFGASNTSTICSVPGSSRTVLEAYFPTQPLDGSICLVKSELLCTCWILDLTSVVQICQNNYIFLRLMYLCAVKQQ